MQTPKTFRYEQRLFLINGIMPDGSTKPIAVVAGTTQSEAGRKLGYGVMQEEDGNVYLMTGEHDEFVDRMVEALTAMEMKRSPLDKAARFTPSRITITNSLRESNRLMLVELPHIE